MSGRLWKIRFEVYRWAGGPHRELVPIVDDISLVDRVTSYEQTAAFDVVDGYAGLVLENLGHNDLATYLTGGPDPVTLLGCDCGEHGCWSLTATVHAEDDVMTWDNFTNPHRPTRNYEPFGPFNFRLAQYNQAVRQLVSGLD